MNTIRKAAYTSVFRPSGEQNAAPVQHGACNGRFVPTFPVQLLLPPLFDPSTPWPNLWEVEQPPERLHVHGSPDALSLLGELPERGLAIVGTRQAQARSIGLIEKTIEQLADSSLIVISGLARGVDTAAHEAALRCDLPTIAILGCGLSVEYPRENAALRQRILEAGGLVISEFDPLEEPKPHHFLLRNRLIAAWAKATWVVEASCRSGALNTAKWARQHHRDTYATPCFPGDLALEGNQRLIDREHANPFWRASSLGQTWLELSTREAERPRRAVAHSVPPELLRLIADSTAAQGGIHFQECLEWALERSWKPNELFLAIRAGVEAGCIQSRRGLIQLSRIKFN